MRYKEHISIEDFENNYEFKLAKKMLLREYPFIKSIGYNQDELNRYTAIYIDLLFNPYEVFPQDENSADSDLDLLIKLQGKWSCMHLAVFFKDNYKEQARILEKEVNEALWNIHENSSIPKEMRLPGDRYIKTGEWYINKSTLTR